MNRTSDHLLSAAASDTALARVCDEIIERLQAGDRVDMASLALEHPEYADQLQRLVPALGALVDLGASAVQYPSRVVSKQGTSHLAPKTLGDYLIVREIGRGGMGVVYEAEQRSLNRRVALKVLPMAAALDARQFQRFQLEAQAAACLHHNNIVPVFAVGTKGGVPFYAMQYIEGRSLAEVILELRRAEGLEAEAPVQDGGVGPRLADLSTTALARSLISAQTAASPFDCPGPNSATEAFELTPPAVGRGEDQVPAERKPPKTASSTRTRDYCRNIAGLGLQAAEALDHAHTRGILHRDIKPANLLLDTEGRLWVADFGLAQIQGNHGLTLSGDILGTLRYMSPEQALAKRVVIDGRTDVYSLGVTIYELLTLQPAFDGKDRAEILRKIDDDEPVPLRKLNASVPPDLETIIHKALAKEPSERYASAKDLADDLRNYLEARPIRARRPSLLDRAAKWGRRHTTSVAAASVILVLAMIGLATSTILIAREQRRTSAALEQANARFQFARKAVDEMYTQVAEKWLAQQPKLTQVQREFLEKALAFYEQFAREEANDPEIQFESARARRRVGGIQRALGMGAQSEDSLRQSIEKLEDLGTRFPGRSDYLVKTADYSVALAGLLVELNRLHEAEPILKRSVAIMDSLVAQDPKNGGFRVNLAGSLRAVGNLYERQGRNEEAESVFRRALDFQPDANDPTLGLVYQNMGRFPEAEKVYLQAIEKAEASLAEEPTNPRRRLGLAISLGMLAGAQSKMGRLEESIATDRRVIALLEALVNEFPDTHKYRGNLLIGQQSLLFHLPQTGRDDGEWERVARRFVELGETLVRDHPAVPDYRGYLANGMSAAASIYSLSPEKPFHNPALALKLARRAMELAPPAGQEALGWAEYRLGDWKGCITTLEKGKDFSKEGDYFGAMAWWQLGDKARAHDLFHRTDAWLAGYEKVWTPATLPSPTMLRRLRAEAAALLGVNPPTGEAKPKPAPESKGPPR